MSGFSQIKIDRTYQNWAKVYDRFTPMYLLGNEQPLRQESTALLHLRPGQTVLDMACGTGRNFPFILKEIGPTGTLIGVDYSPFMLSRAQKRIERSGWKNVLLVQGDAARIDLRQTFDAALCTLAMGVIPDYLGAISRMEAHLNPGGWLAIGDAKRSSLWYGRPLNWLAYVLGFGAAEVMTRQPWASLREMLADFYYKEWFSGFFYVAGGKKYPERGNNALMQEID